jgi:hypothetical protein
LLLYGPEEERHMPIAKITGQGLVAIACSVALLWGSFIGERIMVQRAAAERIVVMRNLQRMQRTRRSEPVSAPVHMPRPVRVTAG